MSAREGYCAKTTSSKSFAIPVRTSARSGVSARSPMWAKSFSENTLEEAAQETLKECAGFYAAETDRLNLSSLSAEASGVNAEWRASHSLKAAGVDTPTS